LTAVSPILDTHFFLIHCLAGNVGAAFKKPITEQLISGPHNNFSLPEGFSSELAGLKGQKLLEQLAANLCSKTIVTDTAQQPEQGAPLFPQTIHYFP